MEDDKHRLAELCGLELGMTNILDDKSLRSVSVEGYYFMRNGMHHKLFCLFEQWDPFTNIEQAMMVAEAMRVKLFSIELHSECLNAPLWFARFNEVLQGESDWTPGNSPAEAICRAALATKEG